MSFSKFRLHVGKSRFLLPVTACVIVFILTIVFDRVLGAYLNSSGYFKAMNPGVTEYFDTKEFTFTAKRSAQGLRNEDVAVPKPQNTLRILTIGDSFTFGWGVDQKDSWVKRLESLISIKGKKIEVINAGVPGITLDTEKDICKAYADYLDADAILIGFFSTDDLNQLYFDAKNSLGTGSLATSLWPTLTRLSHPVIVPGQKATRFGKEYRVKDFWKEQAAGFLRENPSLLARVHPLLQEDFTQGRINPYLITYAASDPNYIIRIENSSFFNQALDELTEQLHSLKKECIRDRPSLFVMFPSYELVSKEAFLPKQLLGYKVDKKLTSFDIDTPVSKIVTSEGIQFISLVSSFRQDGCPNCYYPFDMHLTSKGNARVANFLAPFVESLIR